MFILDASIAVKWFFSNEPNENIAKTVLGRLIDNPDIFCVPDLFYLEVSAVLTRKSGRDQEFCNTALEKLYQLGIRTVPTGQELLQKAITSSCELDISVYDMVYLVTAEFMKAKWLTADEKAVKKVPKSRCLSLLEFR